MKDLLLGLLCLGLSMSADAFIAPAHKQLPNFSKQQTGNRDTAEHRGAMDHSSPAWTIVADQVPGNGSISQVSDSYNPNQTQQYYRLRVLP